MHVDAGGGLTSVAVCENPASPALLSLCRRVLLSIVSLRLEAYLPAGSLAPQKEVRRLKELNTD